MIESVNVIGRGRVGSAVAARLGERGVALDEHRPGPRPSLRAGPRHRRGGGERRTGPVDRPRQRCDAAGCACTSRPPVRRASAADVHAPAGRRAARRRLGGGDGRDATRRTRSAPGSPRLSACDRSPSRDEDRAAYHAGAAIASNYLVTLRHAAGSLLEAAGAPPQALDPLMLRTIENGFELTGPIQRGDWETVERHVEAIRSERPELETLYRVLADATVAVA